MKKTLGVILSVILIAVIIVVIVIFSRNDSSTATLKMNCNGEISEIKIDNNSTLTCKLLGENWSFEIKNITAEKIVIDSKNYGLTILKDDGSTNLLAKDTKFTIEKGKKLELRTQSTDYQESVIFEY